MTYTIYLLFGLLLGFIFGTFAGFGLSKRAIDETIVKAWQAMINNLSESKDKEVK